MSAAPYGTSVKGFRDASPSAGRILGGLDPALLLATLGLVACSIYTLSTATKADIPGDPNFFVFRQSLYVAVGILLMLAISRVDYSRLREWKAGLRGRRLGLPVQQFLPDSLNLRLHLKRHVVLGHARNAEVRAVLVARRIPVRPVDDVLGHSQRFAFAKSHHQD